MNDEKLNSSPKLSIVDCQLSIAKREIFRICKDPIYFFCMLVAPTICVVFFLSLMKEGLPTDMPVAVVDLDGSSNSRNLSPAVGCFRADEGGADDCFVRGGSPSDAGRESVWHLLYPEGFRCRCDGRPAAQAVVLYEWDLSYCRIPTVPGYENHVRLSWCFGRASDGTGAWLYRRPDYGAAPADRDRHARDRESLA